MKSLFELYSMLNRKSVVVLCSTIFLSTRLALCVEFTINGLSTKSTISSVKQTLNAISRDSQNRQLDFKQYGVKLPGLSKTAFVVGTSTGKDFSAQAWLVPAKKNQAIGLLGFDYIGSQKIAIQLDGRQMFCLGDHYKNVQKRLGKRVFLNKGSILICKDDKGQLLVLDFLNEGLWSVLLIHPNNWAI